MLFRSPKKKLIFNSSDYSHGKSLELLNHIQAINTKHDSKNAFSKMLEFKRNSLNNPMKEKTNSLLKYCFTVPRKKKIIKQTSVRKDPINIEKLHDPIIVNKRNTKKISNSVSYNDQINKENKTLYKTLSMMKTKMKKIINKFKERERMMENENKELRAELNRNRSMFINKEINSHNN